MSEILIYENETGNIKVDVIFEDSSIWLSQGQICEVFGKAKSTISELEYKKYKIEQKRVEKEQSLKELEEDIKRLK